MESVIRIRIPEGLEHLVPRYLDTRRKELDEMASLVCTGGFDRLRTLAHNMKGTAQPYGFTDLMALAAALENAAKNGNAEQASDALRPIAEYVRAVVLMPTGSSPTDAENR